VEFLLVSAESAHLKVATCGETKGI